MWGGGVIVGRGARLRGGKLISAFVGGGRGRRKGGRWGCRMRRFEGSDYSGMVYGMEWYGEDDRDAGCGKRHGFRHWLMAPLCLCDQVLRKGVWLLP